MKAIKSELKTKVSLYMPRKVIVMEMPSNKSWGQFTSGQIYNIIYR